MVLATSWWLIRCSRLRIASRMYIRLRPSAADHRLQGDHARSGRYAQLSCRAFGPRGGRMAASRLGLPGVATVAEQLRTRRVDHAARLSEFPWVRRFACARSWTVSAPRTQICAAASFLALSRSNSPFSNPPIRPEFLPKNLRHRSGGIGGTWEINWLQ